MITDLDVYAAYKRAQARAKGTGGYRMPKDWKTHKETKLNDFTNDCLYKMMVHFNTTLSNVDMDKYMDCGFELWKGFGYKQFCDPRIINLYMQYDKQKKRGMQSTVDEIDATFEFLRHELGKYPRREGYGQLQNYCKFREGELRIIINSYIKGKVDATTLVYCIYNRYLNLSDDERALTPYISERYRELVEKMMELKGYIQKKENLLNDN